MNILKYFTISISTTVLIACSSTPTNSESDMKAVSVADSNPDIQCIQEGLNEFGVEAGAEDGVNSEALRGALAEFEDMISGSHTIVLPVLTEHTAAGNCDVLKRSYIHLEIIMNGEPGIDLSFQLYNNERPAAGTEIAKAKVVSGRQQIVFLGERLMQDVTNFCIEAPEGYGFNDTSGRTYSVTCQPVSDPAMRIAGTRTGYQAIVVKE